MAVQQDKVSRSKRGMRRAHDSLKGPTLSEDSTTGETHRRHHVTADGFLPWQESNPHDIRRRLICWGRILHCLDCAHHSFD